MYTQTSLVASGATSIEFQGQGKDSAALRFTNESGQNFYWTLGVEIADEIVSAADQAMDGTRVVVEDDRDDDRLTLYFARRGEIQVDVIGCDMSTDFFAEMSFDVALWQPFIDVIRAHFQPTVPDLSDPEPDPLDFWREALSDIDWD